MKESSPVRLFFCLVLCLGGQLVAKLLLFITLIFGFVPTVSAADDPFRVEAQDASIASPGSGKVTVIIRVPDGFHVYRDMMAVSTLDAGTLKTGTASFPPGELAEDPASPGAMRELYEEDVFVEVPITAATGLAGTIPVTLKVAYQGCKKTLCYMPGEQEVTANVTIGTARPGLPGGAPTDAPGEAATQTAPEEETPVVFTGKMQGPADKPAVVIHADLKGEWHINRDLFSITAPEAGGWVIGESVVPRGEKTGNEADGTAREDLMSDFDVTIPISGTGPESVTFEVWYQACQGVALCKMPTTEKVVVAMKADAASSVPAPPKSEALKPVTSPPKNATPGTDSAFNAAAEQGFGALVVLCFLAGIAVSFTPCVLPIVPITMGIIGARSAGSRIQSVALATTYALGQAVVYTTLALVVAQTGGMFGSWLQSPIVTGTISVFFIAMGFSMFGFFDVQVPNFISSRLQGQGGSGGYIGAAILGMIGALIAGPCSGPVVASILVYIGVQGNVVEGTVLMFSFSMGMGLIFIVTGALAGWLPSRGAWMITVKKAMGILLWLMAINFSAPHLSVTVTALATAAVLLVTGVFSWPDPEDGEGPYTVRFRQLYTLVACVVGSYLLVGTMATTGFILPPLKLSASGGEQSAAKPGIAWLSDHDTAIAEAQKSGKPLLIDFTAEWCAACHELEKYTYTNPEVIAESKSYVPVMIDCTKASDPAVKAIQDRYGVTGLPTVVMVKPDGTILDTLIGFEEAAPFLSRLKKANAGG